MGIFSKARSSRVSFSFGILLIRLSVGLLFLMAGAKKILNLEEFIESVQKTGQMNDTLAFILAFILPFMEMFFGGLFIIGLFTPVAGFFIACMTVSFLFVLGTGHYELPFSYNFVILSCAIASMFTGAGLFSFDALIDREKVKITVSNSDSQQNKVNIPETPVKQSEPEIFILEDKADSENQEKKTNG